MFLASSRPSAACSSRGSRPVTCSCRLLAADAVVCAQRAACVGACSLSVWDLLEWSRLLSCPEEEKPLHLPLFVLNVIGSKITMIEKKICGGATAGCKPSDLRTSYLWRQIMLPSVSDQWGRGENTCRIQIQCLCNERQEIGADYFQQVGAKHHLWRRFSLSFTCFRSVQ